MVYCTAISLACRDGFCPVHSAIQIAACVPLDACNVADNDISITALIFFILDQSNSLCSLFIDTHESYRMITPTGSKMKNILLCMIGLLGTEVPAHKLWNTVVVIRNDPTLQVESRTLSHPQGL